jgi:citrate lyase subunit beta/citryl-CoA lyase
MTIVGTETKSDLVVEMERRDSGGIEMSLESTVGALFGPQIRRTVLDTLARLGVQHARVRITDQGALDWVIQARVEVAVRRLWPVEEPGAPPAKKVQYPHAPKDRLRRTRLYLPGNHPDFMLNAGLFCPDAVILDLEDSVAPADKDAARVLVRNALRQVDFGSAERMVRINSLRTEYGLKDVEMIAPEAPDTLLIPKCEGPEDVQAVAELLDGLESRFSLPWRIHLMPIVESARGVWRAYEIASASDRVVALAFGAEDFTADIGAEKTPEGRESFVARCLVVLGAKAAGVQAIDTVYSDVQDVEGLIQSTRESVSLGFDGKGVIHPLQIEPVHRAFAPTPEQIERARQIVAALEEAERRGSGVATLGSKMIDAPVAARARRILQLAKEMGFRIEGEE